MRRRPPSLTSDRAVPAAAAAMAAEGEGTAAAVEPAGDRVRHPLARRRRGRTGTRRRRYRRHSRARRHTRRQSDRRIGGRPTTGRFSACRRLEAERTGCRRRSCPSASRCRHSRAFPRSRRRWCRSTARQPDRCRIPGCTRLPARCTCGRGKSSRESDTARSSSSPQDRHPQSGRTRWYLRRHRFAGGRSRHRASKADRCRNSTRFENTPGSPRSRRSRRRSARSIAGPTSHKRVACRDRRPAHRCLPRRRPSAGRARPRGHRQQVRQTSGLLGRRRANREAQARHPVRSGGSPTWTARPDGRSTAPSDRHRFPPRAQTQAWRACRRYEPSPCPFGRPFPDYLAPVRPPREGAPRARKVPGERPVKRRRRSGDYGSVE